MKWSCYGAAARSIGLGNQPGGAPASRLDARDRLPGPPPSLERGPPARIWAGVFLPAQRRPERGGAGPERADTGVARTDGAGRRQPTAAANSVTDLKDADGAPAERTQISADERTRSAGRAPICVRSFPLSFDPQRAMLTSSASSTFWMRLMIVVDWEPAKSSPTTRAPSSSTAEPESPPELMAPATNWSVKVAVLPRP
jgi:hypothetical protein